MRRDEVDQQPSRTRKGSTTFLTLPKGDSSGLARVQELYGQLQEVVDGLQAKVDEVVSRNEAEFFTAYKNHIEKVRRELEQIKEKSKNQEKMLSSNDRMNQLQKQIIIFREQALLLYDRLKLKDEQYEELRLKYQESLRENRVLNQQVRNILKKYRNLEVDHLQAVQAISKDLVQDLPAIDKPIGIIQGMRTSNPSQFIDRKHNTERLKQPTRRTKSYWRPQKETTTTVIAVKPSATRHNQYRQIFQECVQSVRRAIYRRKALARPLVKPSVRTDYGSMYITSKKDEVKSKIDKLYMQPSSQQFTEADQLLLMQSFCKNLKVARKMLELLCQPE